MSLRVTIGAGEGHNWWCVVFPPLCEASAVEDAAQAVFSPDEVEFITEQDGGTVIKFKTLEIIAQIKEWFALRRE
jgi:stage II sporulation protein R